MLGVTILLGVGCSRAGDDSGESAQALADLEERLRYHGFEEPAEVRRLVVQLREAAQNGDRSALVNAIHYPFTMYERGSPVREYRSPAGVQHDYDAVFSTDVLNALRTARYESLFVRDQGAMVGDGEVWLFRFDEGVRIKAINP